MSTSSTRASGSKGQINYERQNQQGQEYSLSQTQTLSSGEVWEKQTALNISKPGSPSVTQSLEIQKNGKTIGALKYNDIDGDGRFGQGDKLIKASGICADGQDGNKVAAKFFYDPKKPDASAQTGFDYQDVSSAKTAKGSSDTDYWQKIKTFFDKRRKESGSKDEPITDLNPERADNSNQHIAQPRQQSAFSASGGDFSTRSTAKKAPPGFVPPASSSGGQASTGAANPPKPSSTNSHTAASSPSPQPTPSPQSSPSSPPAKGSGKLSGAFASTPTSSDVAQHQVAGAKQTKQQISNAVDAFYKAHPEMNDIMTPTEAKQMLIAIASFETEFGTQNLDNGPLKKGTASECFSIFNINKTSAASIGITNPAQLLGDSPEGARSGGAVAAGTSAVLSLILKHQKNGQADPVGAFMAEHRGGTTGLGEFNAGTIEGSQFGTDEYMHTVRSIMKKYQDNPETMTDNTRWGKYLKAV